MIETSVAGATAVGTATRRSPSRSARRPDILPAVSSIWRPVRERAPARSLMVIVAHPGDEAFGFRGRDRQRRGRGRLRRRRVRHPRLVRSAPRRQAPGAGRQEPRPEARPGSLAQSRHRPRGRAAALGRRARRARRPHARLRRGRARSRRLRPPRRAHRRADPDASAGGDPELRARRDHRRHRPRRLSRAVRAAYRRAAEPLAYEDVIEEDQVAWRAAKLYELVVPQRASPSSGRARRPRATARRSSRPWRSSSASSPS